MGRPVLGHPSYADMEKNKKLSNDLLFEIGCEELPATSLADFFESGTPENNPFNLRFKAILTQNRLSFKACQTWATPRRLVFYATGLSATQEARDHKTKLVSKEEAFTSDGKLTEKFLFILNARGGELKDLIEEDINGKKFMYICKPEPREKAEKILPIVFESLIKSLNFPKNMKWDDSGILFSRPIRHYLAIFGASALRFKIGGTASAADTVIFLKGKRIHAPVKDIPTYFKALKKYGVILDQVQRKAAIQKELERLSASMNLKLYEDAFLLNEINYLVEIPHALSAPFGDEFLSLPLEVLAVSMARKQRIFGVIDKEGKLAPKLVAVLDGVRTASEKKVISKNIENILQAKLQDSLFFYREDIKAGFEKKRGELKNLVFLKGAGSMLEKSERLVSLAKHLKGELGLSSGALATLEKACFLSKADLLTQMVGEFPELQGIMGKYYALAAGERPDVAEAIGEQYLPRTVSDKLPRTTAGALLSILDKADLINACFKLGLEPTSSTDPYGLRRSASAIFKIIIEKKINLSLAGLIEETPALKAFFKDRFKAVLADHGLREDLVEAAMATSFDRPHEVYSRAEALSKLLKDDSFAKACKVVERTFNILKGNKEKLPAAIDEGVFTENLEREVFKRYDAYREKIQSAQKERDYASATSLYAEAFFDILGEFFEKVFINTEDMKVRTNRLLLLKTIKELYTQNIAELSKIRLDGHPRNL